MANVGFRRASVTLVSC
ncbi:hypothetical protein VCHC55B2_3453A, partial [Vibrio cholerae HC-55B2]